MKQSHEKLLIAALAGVIIADAAAIAVQPALASGYMVEGPAQVSGVAGWDDLNIRLWPASYSRQTGSLRPDSTVWVSRCIDFGASDWCLVEQGGQEGWVNSKFLTALYETEA